jgi:hypothetical protein
MDDNIYGMDLKPVILVFVLIGFSSSSLAADLIVDGTTQTLGGTHNYDNIEVKNGGTLIIEDEEKLIIEGETFFLSDNSEIMGYGKGHNGSNSYANEDCDSETGDKGFGPGGGLGDRNAGGGGSYGGNGGEPQDSGCGSSSTYGDKKQATRMGSGGGGEYQCSEGGDGGGNLQLDISGTTTIDGKINMSGQDVSSCNDDDTTGAGAGGGIRIETDVLEGSGELIASGGDIGYCTDYGGGAGGGGRIAIYYKDNSGSSITKSVDGGNKGPCGGESGAVGTIYEEQTSSTSHNLIIEQGSDSWDIEAYSGSQSYSDAFLDRVSGNSDFVIAPFYNESDGRFSLVVGSEADTDRDVQLDLQNLPSGANVPYSNDDNSNSNSRISGRPEFSVENGHEPEGDWSWGSCCPDGGVLKLPDNWDSFQIDPDTSIGVGPNLVLDTEGMYQDLSHSQTITIINGGNPEIVDININSRRSSGDSIIDVEYSIDSSADLDKCTLEAFEGGSNSKTYNSNTGSNPCIFTISETDLAEWSAGDKIDLELNATDNNGYSASETASSSFIIPSLNLEYSGFLFDFDRPYDGIVLSEVGTDLFGFDVLGNYSKEYSVEAFSGSKIDASFQNYTNGTDTDLPSKQRFLMNLEGSSPGFTTLNLTLTDESTGVKKRQKFEVRVREYRSGSREVPGMTAFQILIVSLMVFILKVGYVRR